MFYKKGFYIWLFSIVSLAFVSGLLGEMRITADSFLGNMFTTLAVFWLKFGLPIIWLKVFLSRRGFKNSVREAERKFNADASFMTFTSRVFSITVDQVNNQVVVNNNITIPYDQFSYDTSVDKKLVHYNTGGTKTVNGSNGAVGSVYVPGESGSYDKSVGYLVKIINSEKRQKVAVVTLSLSQKHEYEFVNKILSRIEQWCKAEVSRSKIEQVTRVVDGNLTKFLEQAGLAYDGGKNCFCSYINNDDGSLNTVIAVDRSGKAAFLYDQGKKSWVGTLKGAVAKVVNGILDVKLEDPAYREKYMAELHIMTFEKQSHDLLMEWEERINLIAKSAALA